MPPVPFHIMKQHPNFHLFLDDVREPRDVTWVKLPQDVHWVVVRNYDQFVRTLQHESRNDGYYPKFISFDHDLADEHYVSAFTDVGEGLKPATPTGYECAKWLIDNLLRPRRLPLPEYRVHSMNPVGKRRILLLLDEYQAWLDSGAPDIDQTPQPTQK